MKTVQEVLNSVHNFSDYDSAVVTGVVSPSVALDTEEMGAYTGFDGDGDLTFSANKPAREVHIHCTEDFSVWINSNADVKEIVLQAADSPFVINNMDVTTLYVSCTLDATSKKLRIQAYYQ